MPLDTPDSLPRARIGQAQVSELCKHTHIQLFLVRGLGGRSEITYDLNNGQAYFMHHHYSAASGNLAWKVMLNLPKDSFSGFVSKLSC